MKNRANFQMELIQALSLDCSLVCQFDLDTGRGSVLRASEELAALGFADGRELALEESMPRLVEGAVFDSDRDMMGQVLSRAWLLDALSEQEQFTVSYRAAMHDELYYYELKAVRWGGWRDVRGAVLCFRSVDGERRAELEREKLLENALHRARQANESRGALLDGVSRELRGPVDDILAMAGLLLGEELPPAAREQAAAISASGRELLSTLDDLLDYSMAESGRLTVTPEAYDFAGLVRDVADTMERRIGEHPVRLVTAIQNEIPRTLCGDAGRIRQILVSLMGNAVKFTTEGAVMLRMSFEPLDEGYIWLNASVMDTGVGIRPEDMETLFDGGAGLGLSIAKLLVERMGGSIGAESEYGKGSCFTFSILQEVLDPAPCAYNSGEPAL